MAAAQQREAAAEAMKCIQLKSHLSGIILRDLTLQEFKYVFQAAAANAPLAKMVHNHMPVMNALRALNLSTSSMVNMCKYQQQQSITAPFIDWIVQGNSYTKRTRVVVALRSDEEGRRTQQGLTLKPVISGVAIYGEYTGRKDLNEDGETDDTSTYKGVWKVAGSGAANARLQTHIDQNGVGEIEFVCSHGGSGSLLVEYCMARLMALRNTKNKAILCNLSSVAAPNNTNQRVYPLESILTRLHFRHVPMKVVRKDNQEEVAFTVEAARQFHTKWYALDSESWRSTYLQHLKAQLNKFTSGLCPTKPRSGISYCT